jgi:hypothetical protein
MVIIVSEGRVMHQAFVTYETLHFNHYAYTLAGSINIGIWELKAGRMRTLVEVFHHVLQL